MKVPVVLPSVRVAVGTDGHLTVDLDGQPYDAERPLDRTDLPAVLDEITAAHETAVRVEVREADGTTYADIATPPESAGASDPPPASDAPAGGVRSGGFNPGEEVAIAYVVARQTADTEGGAWMRLPPALLATRRADLVLVGLTSHAVVNVGGRQ